MFQCSLYCKAVIITDNLCTKEGNSSNFGLKIHSLKSKAVSNQVRVIEVCLLSQGTIQRLGLTAASSSNSNCGYGC